MVAQLGQTGRTEFGLVGKPISPDCLHVSLRAVGCYVKIPVSVVEAARAVAAKVSAAPFQVAFNRVLSFRGNKARKPFVLISDDEHTLAQLRGFYGLLSTSLSEAGWRSASPKRFTPHMTLLYDRGLVPEMPVQPVSWLVKEFVLIDSLVGRSKYQILDRWPLRGADGHAGSG